MLEFWNGISEAQAAIISAVIIVAGGGIGILFGSMLFGGRVRDLKTALDASEARIREHNSRIEDRIASMDEQIAATMDALGQVRNTMDELQQASQRGEEDKRTRFKAHWKAISDRVEQLASADSIHGHTRAAYSRIPRYNFGELLDLMARADHLGAPGDATTFKEAHELFRWHRNGKPPMTDADVQKMREFAIRLVPSYRPE